MLRFKPRPDLSSRTIEVSGCGRHARYTCPGKRALFTGEYACVREPDVADGSPNVVFYRGD